MEEAELCSTCELTNLHIMRDLQAQKEAAEDRASYLETRINHLLQVQGEHLATHGKDRATLDEARSSLSAVQKLYADTRSTLERQLYQVRHSHSDTKRELEEAKRHLWFAQNENASLIRTLDTFNEAFTVLNNLMTSEEMKTEEAVRGGPHRLADLIASRMVTKAELTTYQLEVSWLRQQVEALNAKAVDDDQKRAENAVHNARKRFKREP
ncbi:hypothetical protein UCRPC4_g03313 [Phaeomoniella chlamydospora]|uniref:Uncharacterized protein n=1 Tax=Phaeomoniella chlamydospora TaxID=158046 RepID=A0A0G2H0D6_PHACM|nr:hypothetical protein UCRPC4_g03313 [Phaeomoniella chlamydospora]